MPRLAPAPAPVQVLCLAVAGQGVHVEVLFAGQRHAGEHRVVERALDEVGVARVSRRQQHAPAPHDAGDPSARLAVRQVAGQLVGQAERLGEVPGADAAGDVELALDHVLPLSCQCLQQQGLTRLEVEISGTRGEVERADSVPLDCGRLTHRHTVLERGGAVVAVLPDPAAPSLVQEECRQIEMTPLAGLAVQLDQRHLDLRVAVGRGAPAWPEHGVDTVDEAPGDGEQPIVAGGAPIGDGCLDQMPGAVELVAVGEVRPASARLGDRVVGVEVAVVPLGRGHQLDQRLAARTQLVARRAGDLERGRLQPLVDIGVHEHTPTEPARLAPGGDAEIVEVPGRLQHAEAVRQRRLAVDRLAPRPQAAVDCDGPNVERLQDRARALRGLDGTRRSLRRHRGESLSRH